MLYLIYINIVLKGIHISWIFIIIYYLIVIQPVLVSHFNTSNYSKHIYLLYIFISISLHSTPANLLLPHIWHPLPNYHDPIVVGDLYNENIVDAPRHDLNQN